MIIAPKNPGYVKVKKNTELLLETEIKFFHMKLGLNFSDVILSGNFKLF